MRPAVTSLLCVVCVLFAGCVSVPMTPHQPTLETQERITAAKISPMSLGVFVLAEGKDPEIDKVISLRGSTLMPPENSYSVYLREVVAAELRAAGKLDPASKIVIRGWLTDNQVDAMGTSVGSGSLGARFSLSRDGVVVYDKEHQVKAQWPSSFIGAVALPAAMNEYTALYKKLIVRLFDDAEFRAAARQK